MNDAIFSPVTINAKTAVNRIVIQPVETNTADKSGAPTQTTLSRYQSLAKGGAGLIHIESVDFVAESQARTNRLLMNPDNLSKFRALVSAMRNENPDILIIVQLSHGGGLGDSTLSDVVTVLPEGRSASRTLSVGEIDILKQTIVDAARMAREAGVDGIDFKQAHGFLGGEFIQPMNTREDQYGGSFENRTRFFRELMKQLRSELGPDFIIGTRISPYEGIPGGFGTDGPDEVIESLAEPRKFARLCENSGCDFINVSAGHASGNLEILMPTPGFPEGVFRHFGFTRQIKEAVTIPVIGSGYSYLRDGENNLPGDASRKSFSYFANKNIKDNNCDMVGIGRQSIADSAFPEKLEKGNEPDIHWCTACMGCGILLGNHKKVGCVAYDEMYKKVFKSLEI